MIQWERTYLLVLREIKGLAETSGFLAHFPLLPLSGGKQLFLRQKGDQRHGQGRQTEVDCCADIESHYFHYLILFAQQAYLSVSKDRSYMCFQGYTQIRGRGGIRPQSLKSVLVLQPPNHLPK